MSLRWLAIYGLTAASLLTAPRLCRAQGSMSTVAGSGVTAFGGDGGQATAAWLRSPNGVAVDSAGNLYIADAGNFRIRKVNTAGIISTVAGNGTLLFSGDGGPATNAGLNLMSTHIGLAVDSAGNLYFSDSGNNRIRKVDAGGTITTVAGNGQLVFSGDGGPATNASIWRPGGVAVDSAGNLYIADVLHARVRKVDTAGIITTVAGSGALGFSGDGGPATSAAFNAPAAVAVDGAGNLYIADQTAQRVRKVNTAGIITTVAGNGVPGFSGDGGPATSAQFLGVMGIAADSAGNVYIVDSNNNRIRKVDASGVVTTVAGRGVSGFSGDGGSATNASVSLPGDVAVDASGNLYIADTGNDRIRKVCAACAAPTLSASPSSLSFVHTIGGTAAIPPPQSVSLSSVGAALSFRASSSVSWLVVSPSTATAPVTLSIVANPVGLGAGVYDGTITITPIASGSQPQDIAVTLTVNSSTPPAPGAPTLFDGGIVNGSSFARAPAPVAVGSIVAIFGSGLSTATAGAATIPLPTTLAGAQVLMNGRPAPLFAVSPGQINAQVPWELRGNTTVNIRVVANGSPTITVVTNLAATAPGIFTTAASGSGPAVIIHGDGTLVTPASPAARSEVLITFCTGLGQVTNQPATGSAGPSGPLAVNPTPPTATIGGLPATVLFSGLSPGFVGLYQVNLQVPANAPSGSSVPLVLTAGAQQSNIVSLAIQ